MCGEVIWGCGTGGGWWERLGILGWGEGVGGHGCISGVWWEHGVRPALFVRDSRTWDGGLAMGLVAGRQ